MRWKFPIWKEIANFYKDLDAPPEDYVSSKDNIPNMDIRSVADNIQVMSGMPSMKIQIESG